MHAEAAEDAGDQRLGRGVERARNGRSMSPGLTIDRKQRGDRRHAARRRSARPQRAFPDAQAVLEYLLVGAVEARIDQALGAARALAGDALEMALAGRGIGKDEGGGQEDRRLRASLRRASGRSRAPIIIVDGLSWRSPILSADALGRRRGVAPVRSASVSSVMEALRWESHFASAVTICRRLGSPKPAESHKVAAHAGGPHVRVARGKSDSRPLARARPWRFPLTRRERTL